MAEHRTSALRVSHSSDSWANPPRHLDISTSHIDFSLINSYLVKPEMKLYCHFHSQDPGKKVQGWMTHSLASSAQYLRYSRKWSLSVLVTTRAMSLQKPRWQALMLSFRRSSWAFPPDTRSTSLITQITEHLSMVCRTCPQQGSECGWHLSYRDCISVMDLSLCLLHSCPSLRTPTPLSAPAKAVACGPSCVH